ncbi:MAG: formate--tetrahydrofolate ligase, partial [Kangiellaceae bacterium]
MLSDSEIVKQFSYKPIAEIAAGLQINSKFLMPYGDSITKVNIDALLEKPNKRVKGNLILVSATTPTPAG